MHRSSRWFVLVLQVACAASQVQQQEEPPRGQLAKSVRPIRYDLSLRIDPDQPRFFGAADIAVEILEPRGSIWMHGQGLSLRTATIDGTPARYEQVTEDGVVRLGFDRVRSGPAKLHFEYDGAFDPRLAGLYLASEAGTRYAFTQFEAVDARKAFPCFDDPQFKTPFHVTLTVRARDVAIANTKPVEEVAVEAGLKRIRFAPTPPLPTYLLSWSVGPFDVVTPKPLPPSALRKQPLDVRGVAPRGRGPDLQYALKVGSEILPVLERYFGLAFPYDKLDHIAVPDYAFGAMENAGAINYREASLLLKEGQGGALQRSDIAGTMAHEMAHQWFGDLVTLRWWNDAWLNESFATWLGTKAEDEWDPRMLASVDLLRYANTAMASDALTNARAIRQPVERNADIWSSFDGLTYNKGAAVLDMFERWVTPERFRDGVRRYVKGHAHGSGSTDELLVSLSEAAGKDVTTPFRTFLEQPGVPLVEVRTSCEGLPRIQLTQSRYLPLGTQGDRSRIWQVPVCVRTDAGESCTLLREAEGELRLSACPAWVVPNADASGYYRWVLPAGDLRKLTAASSQLTLREKISLAHNLRAGIASNAIAFADAAAALEPLVLDPDSSVAGVAMSTVELAQSAWVDDAELPALRAYASRLYRAVYRRLGWEARPGDSDGDRRLRAEVIGFLASVARDPEVVTTAAARGQQYFGRKDFDLSALPPDLAEVALAVWLRQTGVPAFDALITRLQKTDDALTRERILKALGATYDPAIARRALDFMLDPTLHQDERVWILKGLMGQRETREAAWGWLQAHHDALLPQIPEFEAFRLSEAAPKFCDRQHLAAFEAFFAPRVQKIPSAPRNLAESLEAARICIAVREAQHASAARFFIERSADK